MRSRVERRRKRLNGGRLRCLWTVALLLLVSTLGWQPTVVAAAPAAHANLSGPDRDVDGLPDSYEELQRTSPTSVDTDGDGLSDYEELRKYLTNPLLADSDCDGLIDSDWNERREYTYTVRVVREIDRPWKVAAMNDFFQDTKVISETARQLRYEVILYPRAQHLYTADPNWQEHQDDSQLTPYLQSQPFANWDDAMQREIVAALRAERVDTDLQAIDFLSDWAMSRSKMADTDAPVDFYVGYKQGQATIEHRGSFDKAKSPGMSDADLLNQQVYGKSMFDLRVHGACGSSSTYLASIYRAAGLPTRIIATTPIVDFNDSRQTSLFDNLINVDERIRLKTIQLRGFADHFFNEVYVGGKWIRVNYSNAREDAKDSTFGFFIKENVFLDFSAEDYAGTWGTRFVERWQQLNPYRTIELSDMAGAHSGIVYPASNPREDKLPTYKVGSIVGFYASQYGDVYRAVHDRAGANTGRGTNLNRLSDQAYIDYYKNFQYVLIAYNKEPLPDSVREYFSPYLDLLELRQNAVAIFRTRNGGKAIFLKVSTQAEAQSFADKLPNSLDDMQEGVFALEDGMLVQDTTIDKVPGFDLDRFPVLRQPTPQVTASNPVFVEALQRTISVDDIQGIEFRTIDTLGQTRPAAGFICLDFGKGTASQIGFDLSALPNGTYYLLAEITLKDSTHLDVCQPISIAAPLGL